MPTLELDAYADAQLLGSGGYAPLTGFMSPEEYGAVLAEARLPAGLPWGLPITLPLASALTGQVTLCYGGRAVAEASLQGSFWVDRAAEAQRVYGTLSPQHPGVRRVLALPPLVGWGPVRLLRAAGHDAPQCVREEIKRRGWRTVAAFQTRNPPHRGHVRLLQAALERVDGALLHPLTGPVEGNDLNAAQRWAAYEWLAEHLGRVILAPYPAAMRYAGPREALTHAASRRNYGATHFIVGRDHAGVGQFYAPDAARQTLEAAASALGLSVLSFPEAQYCPACEAAVLPSDCPHSPRGWRPMSGTAVREHLQRGTPPPVWMMHPEISARLLGTRAANQSASTA